MDFGSCRACPAQIFWARSVATGKAMPLDEDPENGNVAIDGQGRAHVFKDHDAAVEAIEHRDDLPLGNTYLSHHATCPGRRRFKDTTRVQDARPPAQGSLL